MESWFFLMTTVWWFSTVDVKLFFSHVQWSPFESPDLSEDENLSFSSHHARVADIVVAEERGSHLHLHQMLMMEKEIEKGGGWVKVKLYFIEETLISSGGSKEATKEGEGRTGKDCGRWMFSETTINYWVLSWARADGNRCSCSHQHLRPLFIKKLTTFRCCRTLIATYMTNLSFWSGIHIL